MGRHLGSSSFVNDRMCSRMMSSIWSMNPVITVQQSPICSHHQNKNPSQVSPRCVEMRSDSLQNVRCFATHPKLRINQSRQYPVGCHARLDRLLEDDFTRPEIEVYFLSYVSVLVIGIAQEHVRHGHSQRSQPVPSCRPPLRR